MTRASLDPAYFEALYAADPDPWRFETSDYERDKYADTLAALPSGPIGSLLEVGCSIGVLTALLAPRCARLLSVDVADAALDRARARCAAWPHVRFERAVVPGEWPGAQGPFDAILFSEVLYYLAPPDIAATAEATIGSLRQGGSVLLVHWTGLTNYPCSGDEAAELFIRTCEPVLTPEPTWRRSEYRLDRLYRR